MRCPLAPDSRTLAESAWRRGAVRVLSSLELADLPGGGGKVGPQWLVSVSRLGARPRPRDVERALRAFGMAGAEEDNHHSGNARHFWLPVDPAYRSTCECKETEQTIVEADGYTWTNPIEGPCRGCEGVAITGRPCPLHGEVAP